MLLNDARNARDRLTRAEAASSGIEEADALSEKRNELAGYANRISTLASRKAFLREGGVSLSSVPGVDKAKQVISQNSARFVESPKSATLIDKKRWSTLASALTEIAASGDALLLQDWKTYFDSRLFGGVSPEQRKQTILATHPDNQKNLPRYADMYRRFQKYRNDVPSSAEVLHEVLKCSADLSDIDTQLIQNDGVPASVQAFFNATAVRGASLDLLTPEVGEWLRANNMLINYVVRARN